MSERQIDLTKYLNIIDKKFLLKYQLHLIQKETDSSAKQMLRQSIESIIYEAKTPDLFEILDCISKDKLNSSIFGLKKKNKNEEHQKKKNKSPKNSFDEKYNDFIPDSSLSFNVEVVLKKLEQLKNKKGNNPSKYYLERSEFNFILENYSKSFLLAEKFNNLEFLFLTSISSNNLNKTLELIPRIRSILREKKLNYSTVYELNNLIFLIYLGYGNYQQLFDAFEYYYQIDPDYIHPDITNILLKIKNQQFKESFEILPLIFKLIFDSIYTFPIYNEFIQNIQINILSFFLKPYGIISFNDIELNTKLSKDKIIFYLLKGIRKNIIKGKINLIDNTFYGNLYDSKLSQMKEYFEKLQIIQDRLNLSQII